MSELTQPAVAVPAGEPEEMRPRPAALGPVGRDMVQLEDIPMVLAMELARVKISIRELLELAPGSMLNLPGAACDGLSVMLDGQCIARGEIASQDNCYGVRVLEVIDNADARGDQT
jgi:flagellar motor switch protein FliN/FliY